MDGKDRGKKWPACRPVEGRKRKKERKKEKKKEGEGDAVKMVSIIQNYVTYLMAKMTFVHVAPIEV